MPGSGDGSRSPEAGVFGRVSAASGGEADADPLALPADSASGPKGAIRWASPAVGKTEGV
jgi:hypothetical protein